MKPLKILMLAALPLALTACSVSTQSVNPIKPPVLVAPDSRLLKKCGLPADLGNGALTQARVEELWADDRYALLDCYRRHLALRNFIVERDDALRGGE
jgi:hypothetical protein